MAIFRMDEIREMDATELKDQISDLQKELVQERGQIEVGGFSENPGRLGEMRKTIARMKTVLNERSN
ncbi:50S ribosomal protein L29 [Candidatus Haloredivivus sp. G17]|nr:50S ribosomal protein L29 [Candidatus Haloredivivus sp. G17]